uniref:F-box domain-containing protein n=1 Tax=Physcomitrium patens TaxID=3218 RepID=A0A2K1IZI4_PHYPA|nr:hypothetical protein PHYPA_022584 [Physcomitrium patens]
MLVYQEHKQENPRMWGSDEAIVLEHGDQGLGTEEALLNYFTDLCLRMIIPFLSLKAVVRSACVCREFQNTLDSDSV